jgi:hypothetical protein
MSVPRNPDHDDALPYGVLLGETRRVDNRCKSFDARMSEINKRLDKMDEISIEMRYVALASTLTSLVKDYIEE